MKTVKRGKTAGYCILLVALLLAEVILVACSKEYEGLTEKKQTSSDLAEGISDLRQESYVTIQTKNPDTNAIYTETLYFDCFDYQMNGSGDILCVSDFDEIRIPSGEYIILYVKGKGEVTEVHSGDVVEVSFCQMPEERLQVSMQDQKKDVTDGNPKVRMTASYDGKCELMIRNLSSETVILT
ncbi:MAG: hypothetical protein Q4B85_02235 [Lachnospiraceae bacterium]|nr:hypothetical protein [Lachnospiraceae bacterium]